MQRDEFVLFEIWSKSWKRNMPVTFIQYLLKTGEMLDIHCQTGDHHIKAISYARKILNHLGISVSRRCTCHSSGCYYRCRIGGYSN